jgi:hypothetical protein
MARGLCTNKNVLTFCGLPHVIFITLCHKLSLVTLCHKLCHLSRYVTSYVTCQVLSLVKLCHLSRYVTCHIVSQVEGFGLKLWRLRLTCAVFKDPVRTAQWTHFVSVLKTSHLMLYREIIAVCSQIHTKHMNKLCGLNVELLNVKPVGTYSDYWALKGEYVYHELTRTQYSCRLGCYAI